MGLIEDVREYPQQFLASIQYQEKEVLIPLNEAFIVEIDKTKKLLILDLPDGLLELY